MTAITVKDFHPSSHVIVAKKELTLLKRRVREAETETAELMAQVEALRAKCRDLGMEV